MEKKNILIHAVDDYGNLCLSDEYKRNNINKKRGPEGYVHIYKLDENGKKEELISKPNLVVYRGRELVAQKLFNQLNGTGIHTLNEYIGWLGVGVGGTVESNPFDPISPRNIDTDLTTPVPFDNGTASYGDPRTNGFYKHPLDIITFEQDSDNDSSYLICKVDTTISTTDANGYNLNEAGLYTASNVSGGYEGPFNLYAKITFPSIPKDDSMSFLIEWYIYF